jgi:hypothetical protein
LFYHPNLYDELLIEFDFVFACSVSALKIEIWEKGKKLVLLMHFD